MARTVGVALVILVALHGCSRREPSQPVDAAAPDGVTIVTAEQLHARMVALQANAVLVNAWATWCDSCQHELPMLQKVASDYADRGVRVLLVSVDELAERPRIRGFLEDGGIGLTSYLASRPLGAFKSGLHPRWPGMLPATFLFDGAGKLRYFWGGEAYEREVVPVLDGLLAGRNIDGEANFGLAPGQTTVPR